MLQRKLGKKAAIQDVRTPHLDMAVAAHLLVPPETCDWGAHLENWPLWRNGDQLSNHGQTIPGLGDCTAVSVASAIRVMTATRGGEIVLTDDQVVTIYEANGYDPARPQTDQGAVEIDVLSHWCETGYAIGRQAPDVLTAYGSLNWKDRDAVRRAVASLGGLYIGLALPDYALYEGAAWSAPTQSYTIAGGHAVFVHGYDADGLWLNTWAERKRMDWGFFETFCDEAYGLLSRDWLDIHGDSPMRETFASVAAEWHAARTA